jgi:hypothetical protein
LGHLSFSNNKKMEECAMKASVAIVDATGNGTGPDKKWNKNK